MAKKQRRADDYDDSDEIDQAIREFNTQEPPVEETEQPEDEEEPVRTENVIRNDVPETVLPIDFTCPCCQLQWTVSNKRFNKPPCSCPIYSTCKTCDKCTKHCECKKQKQQEAA